MHASHQFRTPLVRRIVVSAIAAAALSTPVIIEMAAQGHPATPTRSTVAMPDCENNWAPICDRWDVPGSPEVHGHPTHPALIADQGRVGGLGGSVAMPDCTHHWSPICGMHH